MHFGAVVNTDTGTVKETNQDSLLMKHGICRKGEVLLAVICDGMGGLDKGEVASAAVIREFSKWFKQQLPFALVKADMEMIGRTWIMLLKRLNRRIAEYGERNGCRMGTTFTGILFVDKEFVVVHVGDSRLYHLADTFVQLTMDHTFVAREIGRGTLTPEQARTDRRRNMLLQCVGASEKIKPQLITGKVKKGVYLLCSDGFRHEISEAEIYEMLNPKNLPNREAMEYSLTYLIEKVKARRERDNISVILIKVG